jgi:hypothetical protein
LSKISEIKNLRTNSSKRYEDGLKHGFWVQQLANSELCLETIIEREKVGVPPNAGFNLD